MYIISVEFTSSVSWQFFPLNRITIDGEKNESENSTSIYNTIITTQIQNDNMSKYNDTCTTWHLKYYKSKIIDWYCQVLQYSYSLDTLTYMHDNFPLLRVNFRFTTEWSIEQHGYW